VVRHRPPGPPRGRPHRERGQVLPLLLVVLTLAAAAAVVVVDVAVAARERARAQRAADAAALAAAAAGPGAASELAVANGGEVRSIDVAVASEPGRDTVAVEVASGRAHAVATAERRRPAFDPAAPAPALVAALRRAEQLLGRPLPVVSASGLVVEVAPDVAAGLAAVAAEAGLCPRSGGVDPVHFETCPPTPP
jgi:hypothetical protein